MNWQQQATHFAQRYNLQHSAQVHALDLFSELGEVSKELLKATNYGTSESHYRLEMVEELGDVLYSLCLLAESVGVDLESALQSTLAKYEQRWQAKGHIGSQILD
jgi:NTP pyrophosphatase (non-canonical NTP hydrolase)